MKILWRLSFLILFTLNGIHTSNRDLISPGTLRRCGHKNTVKCSRFHHAFRAKRKKHRLKQGEEKPRSFSSPNNYQDPSIFKYFSEAKMSNFLKNLRSGKLALKSNKNPFERYAENLIRGLDTDIKKMKIKTSKHKVADSNEKEYAINSAVFRKPNVKEELQRKTRKKLEKKLINEFVATSTKSPLSFFDSHPDSYDKKTCLELRVPCRFVNDHPCCQKFEMPLALVARSRSMDGSADLKWRRTNNDLLLNGYYDKNGVGEAEFGPRMGTVAKARSLYIGGEKNKYRQIINPESSVKYTFAKRKQHVQTPEYFFSSDPEATSDLLNHCWRLHYLKCSLASISLSNTYDDNEIHPCCRLKKVPGPKNPGENRLSRWLKTIGLFKSYFP